MPPKPRGPEGGEFQIGKENQIRKYVESFSMSPNEALALVDTVLNWIDALAENDDAGREIRDQVIAVTAQFQETHGPSARWDEIRISMAGAFIALAQFEHAADILVQAHDTTAAIDRASKVVVGEVQRGSLGANAIFEFSDIVQAAYERAGRGEEFLRAGFATLFAQEPQLQGKSSGEILEELTLRMQGGQSAAPSRWQARAQKAHAKPRPAAKPEQKPKPKPAPTAPLPEVSYAEAEGHYPHAPWAELGSLADQTNYWPGDMDVENRLRLVVDFGVQLSNTVGAAKIERKNAEALKAFITERQHDRPGEAWDRLRFMAALAMYDNGGEKFGRIFARSMDDPQMTAMVVHALIERGRDKEALEVLHDIPDYIMIGKMLAQGEWHDAQAIDALIEDVTVVLPTARRKHEPAYRIGVAEGLHQHYAATPGEVAAEQAAKFQARAELLQRQIDSGYIKSARKK